MGQFSYIVYFVSLSMNVFFTSPNTQNSNFVILTSGLGGSKLVFDMYRVFSSLFYCLAVVAGIPMLSQIPNEVDPILCMPIT